MMRVDVNAPHARALIKGPWERSIPTYLLPCNG